MPACSATFEMKEFSSERFKMSQASAICAACCCPGRFRIGATTLAGTEPAVFGVLGGLEKEDVDALS